MGANCEYLPSTDAAGNTVTPPQTGAVSTDPARIGVNIVTNRGKIGLKLANNESPCTVNSFVSLAQQKFFDGTQCHRLTTAPRVVECCSAAIRRVTAPAGPAISSPTSTRPISTRPAIRR